jgi:hypothetical protein
MPETATFACPRCHRDVAERFYGPCTDCRHELGRQLRSEGGELAVDRFEPKLNVVPNHVATKD